MTYLNKIVVIACVSLAALAWLGECKAEEFKYHLNLLPVSEHHGSTDTTNEKHDGIGFSVTLPNRATFGAMHYTNSYGDDGWIVSMSGKLDNCSVCLGAGVGFAPAYAETGHSTLLAWGSLSYKWVTVMTVPTEVTAIVLSIPLN